MKLKLNNNVLSSENMQLRTRVKRLERDLENKDQKIIGKIKLMEAQIHSSYQQESDTKPENNSTPFPPVCYFDLLSSSCYLPLIFREKI